MPGLMHVPEGITKEQLEEVLGCELEEQPQALIQQTVTKVQPMDTPSSLIFYMDYQYKP